MIATLTAKVIDGIQSQGWKVLGRGGTWVGAMRPLEQYIQRKVERAVRAEREACAQIADAEASIEGIAQRVAAAVRARGNT